MSQYILELLVLMATYVALTAALDLVAGRVGLLSVCHAAVFGCGAYVAAVLSTKYGWATAASIASAGAAGVFAGWLLGAASAQVSAEYFVILTFGAQVALSAVFVNWIAVTRGPMGIAGVASLGNGRTAALIIAAASTAILAAAVGIARSPFGRVLTAIRDDEFFATAIGCDVPRVKRQTVVLSCALTSAAGALFAHWTGYISPEMFSLDRSLLILSMLALGGGGSFLGITSGALILVLLPEAVRFLAGGSFAANIEAILYGGVLLSVIFLRPKGFSS